MKAAGGTEIQFAELAKRIDPSYFKKIQITTSVPEKEPIDPDKISILWMKNSYDQPNIAPWFRQRKTIENMIGMYSILIGVTKNLDTLLDYQHINVV